MKKLLYGIVLCGVFVSLSTGCVSTQVSETPDYEILSSVIEIPVRDGMIPATAVMPVGEGKFPLVVLAHGHGGTRDENGGYADIAEELAKHGMATVRMDFPGCGASTESFRMNTLSNMRNDVDAVISYMVENYAVDGRHLGIFGYSMGGRIALAMACDGDHDFDGMVLLAPAVDGKTMINFLGGQEAWNRHYTEAREKGYTVFTTIFGAVQELSQEWFDDLLASDPIDVANKYEGEALVIYGEDDFVVSPDVSKAAAEALGCPVLDVTGDTHSYSFYSDSPRYQRSHTERLASTPLSGLSVIDLPRLNME